MKTTLILVLVCIALSALFVEGQEADAAFRPNGRNCQNIRCRNGFRCELEFQRCRFPPCGQQPVCRRFREPSSPCDGVRCPSGTICNANAVNCFRAPCVSVPVCYPVQF